MTKGMEIDVYGQRLVLRPHEDQAYVQELARYVEEQMDAVARGLTRSTPTKIAILAAMNIAHHLFQQEQRHEAGEAEIDRRADGLLSCIDSRLDS